MRKKIVVSVIVIITFFFGCASMYLLISFNPLKIKTSEKTINEYKIEETASYDAIDKVYDAVVVVEVYIRNQLSATGTGFVYRKDSSKGYILTNYHVVSNSTSIKVIMTNGNRVDATVLGTDDIGDIAVLSIPIKEVIKVAELATTDDIRVGSTVFAIGAPMGSDYSGTTTKGCISAKNRMVTYSANDLTDNVMRVIQTDAAINPGNSGGPLIDLSGQVVGITSSKLVEEQIEGIGFAIPTSDVVKYISKLEKGEKIIRPALGITLIDIGETYQLFIKNINVSSKITSGVVIESIADNSSAQEAGLKIGDVITKIGDITVKNKAQLRYELYNHQIGEKINITYYRNGNINKVSITLKGSAQ